MRDQTPMPVHRLLTAALASLVVAAGPLAAPQPSGFDPEALSDARKVRASGRRQEAVVPDSLDLAAQAALSLNCLVGNMEPRTYYGVYQGFRFDVDPPRPHALTWNISPKNARTLPYLRAMTGSDYGVDAEVGLMRALLRQIAPNGQMYYPFDGAGPPRGTSYPQSNASTLLAALLWYDRDRNPEWRKAVDLLASGLRASAIQVGDRAYYPLQSGIDRAGKWHFMLGAGEKPIPYNPPDEPRSDQDGLEGASKSDQARCMAALARHYRLTGNRESLALARKLLKFCLKPGMWTDTRAEGYPGEEHGIWGGHFHNNTNCLMAMLDVAEATNDDRLRQFIREGYDHARRSGVVRLGWFPAWTNPARYNRPAWLNGVTEPCAVGDMVALAVKLTDAGLGDYWDDVDYIVRNQLVAQQIGDLARWRSAANGRPENDALRRRFLGGFGGSNPTAVELTDLAGCCAVNGAQGLAYAWHGITRFDRGVATVNLFLNRSAPWMEIESHLPYEGKVVLRNRQARSALVRIPAWVDPDQVRATVAGKPVKATRTGHSLLLSGLNPGDEVILRFAVPDWTDRYTIAGNEYTARFRGSTVWSVSPQDTTRGRYALYQGRARYRYGPAPLKRVTRFTPDRTLALGPF
jgi:hypothetical protein